ncbi:hypothetical protein PybrP1_006914 [[Pythium] brassicae (nom. inval.)]|nr:hypothetical protein PybrP1_006914 [[Pythium] brassicae (nom. inval.)]
MPVCCWSVGCRLGSSQIRGASSGASPVCAAYIDAAVQNGVVRAPKGKVASDVMTQAFTSDVSGERRGVSLRWMIIGIDTFDCDGGGAAQGNTIVNGTRNGATWLWDVRTNRRAQEHRHVAFGASSQRRVAPVAAAIVDLHVLRDGFQVVVLKSDGALSLVDVRTFKTAVAFAEGSANAYLPMLKCAVVSEVAEGRCARAPGI